MRVQVATVDAATFEQRAAPLLLADEARHNLLLGLLGTLRRDPGLYPDHAFWLVEDEAGAPAAAALRTRPHRLVLARPTGVSALDALAAALDEDLPGVVAGAPEARAFARAWERRRGVRTTVSMEQGVYALERLLPPAAPPGEARPATEKDRPLLLAWLEAFSREALNERQPDRQLLERMVDYRFTDERAGLVLWDDGGPVSLAGYGGETPNGARIGPVYTPPERRGRGYGGAVTAAVTAGRLDAGRRFCFLYTDLANPVSNGVYERIGYRRVCESLELDFTPEPPGWRRRLRPGRRRAP